MARIKPEPDIKIGTSGFFYPDSPPEGWNGLFYPEDKSKDFDFLEYYCRYFTTVEIDATFYEPPPQALVEDWDKKSPEGFRFSVKAWQKFTHSRGVDAWGSDIGSPIHPPTQRDVDLFRRALSPLARSAKLGALMFQFPSEFQRNEENLDRLQWTLQVFQEFPKVVELSHSSWTGSGAETRQLLSEWSTSWMTVIDEPKFDASIRQGGQSTGEMLYLRAQGKNVVNRRNTAEPWMRYDYLYSLNEIRAFAAVLKQEVDRKGKRSKIFVYFTNYPSGKALANSLMLNHEMGIESDVPLPPSLLGAFPELVTLSRSS